MAECFIYGQSGGDDTVLNNLLSYNTGLTQYFDFQNGVDINNLSWTDMMNKTTVTLQDSSSLILGDGYIDTTLDGYFLLSYGTGLYSYTIYAIIRKENNISGWTSLIGSYGTPPEFNLTSYSGNLAIGTGDTKGMIMSNIQAYGEWHICCLCLGNGFGSFYIDGVEVGSYSGYYIPVFTDNFSLYFGYGHIKMVAVCDVAHGQDKIIENSNYLKNKYLNDN